MATKKPAPKARAKRTVRTPDERAALIEKIFARIRQGASVRKACEAEGIVESRFSTWMQENEELKNQYASAREAGWNRMAQDIIDISDEQSIEGKYNGEEVKLDLSAVAVARNRLRVDSRKWLLSKMLPKVYGDKVAVTGEGGGVIKSEVTILTGVPQATEVPQAG